LTSKPGSARRSPIRLAGVFAVIGPTAVRAIVSAAAGPAAAVAGASTGAGADV
jgi:hypothetical protein